MGILPGSAEAAAEVELAMPFCVSILPPSEADELS